MSMGREGITLWFTGLSGAGKSTVADEVTRRLAGRGVRVQRLDGDVVRTTLCADLGFSREDRDTNIARVAFVAGLLTEHGVITLASFISPFRSQREQAREIIGSFAEVYVRCGVETCIRRDPKGLYRKALAGEIPNFTGISQVYQEPRKPELVLDTEHRDSEACVAQVINYLEEQGYVARSGQRPGTGLTPEEEAEVEARLQALGYFV